MRRDIGSAVLALVLIAVACSDGRESFNPPHFVTFQPGTGTAYSVQVTPIGQPRVRNDVAIGLGNEGWTASGTARFGLVYDADSNKLTQVDFRRLDGVREGPTFFNIASFRVDGVEFSPNGTTALLRTADFSMFKVLEFVTRTTPLLSGDVMPRGPVERLTFPRGGRFGLLTYTDTATEVDILDPADLTEPLVPFTIDVETSWDDFRFLDLVPDTFVALEKGTGRLIAYRYDDRDTEALEVGSATYPDLTLVEITPFFTEPRVALTGASGEVFFVDLAVIDEPRIVNRFSLPTPIGSFLAAISPDDRFYAVAETATGRLLLYNVEQPEVPLLIGSFDLGGEITAMQFSSDDDVREFRSSPSVVVVTGGEVSLVDLADPLRPILGGKRSFPLATFETFRMRDRLLLTGIDSSGRVVTFDLSDAEAAESIGTFDLGIGGGLSDTIFLER